MNRCNMIKIFLLFIAIFTSQIQFAQSRADSIRMQILERNQSTILVSAHRGDWRNFNENSLSGINSAIKMGVDIVEIDIQRTKDGHFILMHDETLDRTTTGNGRVDSIELSDIKTLKLRNGIGVPTQEGIPTLEEALTLAKGRVILNIDKADRYIGEVLKILTKHKMQKTTIIKTEMPFADTRVRFHDYLLTPVLLMPIVNLDLPYAENDITSFLNFMKPKIFELTFSETPQELVQQISQNMRDKTSLWYNTMWKSLSGNLTDDLALENEEVVYGYLIDSLGANIIQTDRPRLLLNYLIKRDLHE